MCKKCCRGSFVLFEETYGFATKLSLSSHYCNTSHCIDSSKSEMKRTKSELCHNAVNIKFSVTLQIFGVGGQHAST
jgi:hypothetical protein